MHQNDLGDIEAITGEESGGIVSVYERHGYGDDGVREAFDASFVPLTRVPLIPHGYKGRLHEPVSELLDQRNRWLHARLGRFTSRDPMGMIDGPNVYLFAVSDPYAFGDPFGLCAGNSRDTGPLVDGALSNTLLAFSTEIYQAGQLRAAYNAAVASPGNLSRSDIRAQFQADPRNTPLSRHLSNTMGSGRTNNRFKTNQIVNGIGRTARVVGRVGGAAGAVASAVSVATAPAGQRARALTQAGGGTLGAIGGAAAGGTAGTFVAPGVGTVIGGVGGGIAGGYIGSAAAGAVYNAIWN